MKSSKHKVQFRASKKRAPGRVAVDRLAQQIALAYAIERAIDAGVLRDYAHAAQALGVSRARIAQLLRVIEAPAAVIDRAICKHGR
ncbi:MAG: hypothetical protein JNJ88_03735 [Planctomycetes bacterium]|nr:hypothetical protein [Planctomycetota bacterium]